MGDDLDEFKLSKKAKEKLKDKALLKREICSWEDTAGDIGFFPTRQCEVL